MIEPTGKFWETVYSQNIGKMIGICYRYTANRQLSEDLAHDAFLKAIDKAASFEGKGCFEAWLRRIVVNQVLQYIRDQKRRKHLDDWLQHESSFLETGDNNLNANPSEHVEFSEKELLAAINDLPEHHRLVFNLYVIDNFTHVQIGEALGISSGTSKSHLARARKKIKQLLTQKVTKEQDRKRSLLLFFFLYKPGGIDQLYRKQFSNLGLPPEKIITPDFSEAPAVPVVRSLAVTSWKYAMVAASIGVMLTAVFYLYQRQNRISTAGPEPTQSTIHTRDQYTGLVQKSKEELNAHEKTDDRENNSRGADSMTATIFQNSIILRKTIKTKSMKSLDSLGIMFLMSSGILFDTAAQADRKENIPVNTETQMPARETLSMDSVEASGSPAVSEVKKSKREHGTFYASSLFWSGGNHELYLKGIVRVEVGDNNFRGNGSFNFLGPVYLLIVNDKPATLGSEIKLSSQQYQLKRLTNGEATKKYGERGRQGAVEISEVK